MSHWRYKISNNFLTIKLKNIREEAWRGGDLGGMMMQMALMLTWRRRQLRLAWRLLRAKDLRFTVLDFMSNFRIDYETQTISNGRLTYQYGFGYLHNGDGAAITRFVDGQTGKNYAYGFDWQY